MRNGDGDWRVGGNRPLDAGASYGTRRVRSCVRPCCPVWGAAASPSEASWCSDMTCPALRGARPCCCLHCGQDVVLNVSLTAITMLWNVSDHLARSRGTLSKGRAAQHLNRVQSAAAAAAAASAASAASPAASAAAPAAAAAAASGGGAGAAQTQPVASAPVAIAASGTSYNLFSASAGAADAVASAEKPMSPAFAAALSFARGVPSRPASASPGGSVSAPDAGPTATPTTATPTAATPTTATPTAAAPTATVAHSRLSATAVAAGAPTVAALPGAAPAGGYPLHDLNEEESIAMLMIAFRSLKSLSVDPRPEVRRDRAAGTGCLSQDRIALCPGSTCTQKSVPPHTLRRNDGGYAVCGVFSSGSG